MRPYFPLLFHRENNRHALLNIEDVFIGAAIGRSFFFLGVAVQIKHVKRGKGVEKTLMEGRAWARQYQDRQCIAKIQRTYARFHTVRGDLSAARVALAEAIDLFERLGMRRELAEARAALADLDARELAEAAG